MILLIDHDAKFLEEAAAAVRASLGDVAVETKVVTSESEFIECAQFAAVNGGLLQAIFLDIVFRESAPADEWLSSAALVAELHAAVPHVPLIYMTNRIHTAFLFVVCWGSVELVDAVIIKQYLLGHEKYNDLFPLDLRRFVEKARQKREILLAGARIADARKDDVMLEKLMEEYLPSPIAWNRLKAIGARTFLGLAETHRRRNELNCQPYLTEVFTEGFSSAMLLELTSRHGGEVKILKVGPRAEVDREQRATALAVERCPGGVVEAVSGLSSFGRYAAFLMKKHDAEVSLLRYIKDERPSADVLRLIGSRVGEILRSCWSDAELTHELGRLWGPDGRLRFGDEFSDSIIATLNEVERFARDFAVSARQRTSIADAASGLRSFVLHPVAPSLFQACRLHSVSAHGDLHLENILVDRASLAVRLLDFGQNWPNGMLELDLANLAYATIFDAPDRRELSYFSFKSAVSAGERLLETVGSRGEKRPGSQDVLFEAVVGSAAPSSFLISGRAFRGSLVWQLLRHARFTRLPLPRRVSCVVTAWKLVTDLSSGSRSAPPSDPVDA